VARPACPRRCGRRRFGTVGQGGVSIADLQTIVISHLHFDHTGGLFAILALRYQGAGPMAKPLTIYGPPGIKAMVEAMRSAMQQAGALYPSAPPTYTIVELNDGDSFNIGDLKVTAAANSHYGEWKGKGAAPVSLSYRFDMPGRSIVYTGDTGPIAKVEKLAQGADLLVSEIMDADTAIGQIKKRYPKMPPFVLPFLKGHFVKEHLLADQIGLLASRAGVKSVLLTHFGGDDGTQAQMDRLTKGVAANYSGPIRFAKVWIATSLG
jgi:ribonuclease BN (tRNA processing enzyme)